MRKTLLQNYHDWVLVIDGSHPAYNYCLFNINEISPSAKERWLSDGFLPGNNVSFCSNLESALKHIYQRRLVDSIQDPTMSGILDAQKKADMEFSKMFEPKVKLKNHSRLIELQK